MTGERTNVRSKRAAGFQAVWTGCRHGHRPGGLAPGGVARPTTRRGAVRRLGFGVALAVGFPLWACAQSTNVVLGPITNETEYASAGVVEYRIAAGSAGNGAVTGEADTWIESGATASLTAQPAEFYEFDRWDDGASETVREWTVAGPTNLTALFKKRLDADGVAEDWKAGHSVTNVWEDSDKDGALDIEEYFADTDPQRDDDYFRVWRQTDGGEEQVGFPGTSTNCEYDVLESGSLQPGSWNVRTNFPGSGSAVYINPGVVAVPMFIGGKARRVNP